MDHIELGITAAVEFPQNERVSVIDRQKFDRFLVNILICKDEQSF